ncbi:acyltransferase family protein [Hymenobacter busanensis]|nr:acyltransferase [Hymenobacter busanensis]
MVFFFHVAELTPPSYLQGFVKQWFIGVTIFFVLSGFLIAHRYMDWVTLTPGWWRVYLRNRFARIYPIFFLLTAGVFVQYALRLPYVSSAWVDTYTWKDRLFVVLANLTLTRAFFGQLILGELPTAWTLTVEETFYLSAPLLLLLVRRRAIFLVIWPVVALVVGLVLVGMHVQIYRFMESTRFMIGFTYFGRATDFIMGVALAVWLRRQPAGRSVRRCTLIGSLAIIGIMACSQYLIGGMNSHPTQAIWYVPAGLLQLLALPFFIAVLLAGLTGEQSLLRRVLETKTAHWLGKASYVFYLIHGGPYKNAFTTYVTDNTWVRLAVGIAVSLALYKWVEHPLNQFFRAKQAKPTLIAVPA